ncbi:unnamed protein product [Prunus armeniaca]|uniref:F-box domain-containing protein n=1 Tax=Prunus armeniaca TaxID=36596 RepID=A0A6J5VA19_PRUAR|nr:unnamed protein product [Prunus armeniaca]
MQQTQSPPSKRNHSPSLLLQCSELVLSWLTPQELATISLTCSTLHTISKSITLRRASDASRAFESHPIPFHNSVDEHPAPILGLQFFLHTNRTRWLDLEFKRCVSWTIRESVSMGVNARHVGKREMGPMGVRVLVALTTSLRSVGRVVSVGWIVAIG